MEGGGRGRAKPGHCGAPSGGQGPGLFGYRSCRDKQRCSPPSQAPAPPGDNKHRGGPGKLLKTLQKGGDFSPSDPTHSRFAPTQRTRPSACQPSLAGVAPQNSIGCFLRPRKLSLEAKMVCGETGLHWAQVLWTSEPEPALPDPATLGHPCRPSRLAGW